MGEQTRHDLADLGRFLNRYLLGLLLLAGCLVGCSRPIHGVVDGGPPPVYGSALPRGEDGPPPVLAEEGDLAVLGRIRGRLVEVPATSEICLIRDASSWRAWLRRLGPAAESLSLPPLEGRIVLARVVGRDGGLRPGLPRRGVGEVVVPVSRGGVAGTYSCLVWEDPGLPLRLDLAPTVHEGGRG